MNSEKVDAMHLVELGFIQAALVDAGIQAELLEKSEEIPLHVLLAPLGKDRDNKDRFVNFSYIPIADDGLDYIRLLQLFSVIPSDLNSKHLEQVSTLINNLNGQVPIGHFNIKEDGEINFRYVHCVPSDESIVADVILEVLNLFNFSLSLFTERIEDVANGKINLKEALSDL
ncbi:MAG: hypothetical protein WDZ91_10495 [Paenibacillaceae bacterium]